MAEDDPNNLETKRVAHSCLKKRNPSLVARFVSDYMLSKSAFVNFLLRLNNVSREEVKWFKVST